MPKPVQFSAPQARRIALAAQGFGRPARSAPGLADLRRLLARLGAIQIDSVNVLVRSQYLPAFSRLGAYDRALLDRLAHGKPRRAFEYWGHEASILPLELFPLLRWRMERARRGEGMWKFVAGVGREKKALVKRVLETIAARGPLAASEIEEQKRSDGWWGWTDTKRAVEYLFWCGEIAAVRRSSSFERVYDLTERAIPPEILRRSVDDEEAWRQLVVRAASSFGIATEIDLRDYFRLPVAAAKRAAGQLVESGELIPAAVEGWKQPAYLHRDARKPRRIEGSALLSPFDSLVWNRPRTHRLFDFHYRIEIYTPARKRVHGYYVLPYLLNEDLAARVDLKADRAGSCLLVHAVHYEPKANHRAVLTALRGDLRRMASWLGLARVQL
jgi:uncharacterized protein YcaQ